jgi:hypothetical protein
MAEKCDHVAGYHLNPQSGATCWDCGEVVDDTPLTRPQLTGGEVEITPEEWSRIWYAAGNGVGRLGNAIGEFELILKERMQAARDDERARVLGEVERALTAWASVNEIAAPPLDWSGLGSLVDVLREARGGAR